MHIPDNFLSTPVWAAFDAISIPAVGLMVKHAGRELEDSRIPLLGVMGAFVFAAQMINFPVAVGTSSHLVGGALLACTLGAAPAVLVMTVIIATQAFVFQDGGVLALGANVFNMAIAGVLAGYLPIRLWGAGRRRSRAIFAGALLSVMVSGSLALGELLISGVAMPRFMVLTTLGIFAVNALIEGAITVTVVGALEKLDAKFVRSPAKTPQRAMAALGGSALVLGAAGFLFASTAPDGIERLGIQMGIAAKTAFHAPLADYTLGYFGSPWLRKAAAALAGLLLIYAVCVAAAKWIGREKSA
ncbi:MAG TPA: energy-coupling factor ABC transporter permease [Bryobacteraceae bacterium]|nr:energy-coupling factor ABC transporter permease [Bryobacteraceae bacterium]